MEFINYEPTSMVNSPWNPTKDDPAVNCMNYVSFSATRALHEQPLHAHSRQDIVPKLSGHYRDDQPHIE